MRISKLFLAAAILAAAAGGASAYTLTKLHDFCQQDQCSDGKIPQGGVIRDADGNLFGTFSAAGAHLQGGGVYELSPNGAAWTYKVLYSFCADDGCSDGAYPIGSLIRDVHGSLYGVTQFGGHGDNGTVFQLQPKNGHWVFKTLHTFCASGCSDGSQPVAKLTYAGEAQGQPYDGESPLYGTTSSGGAGFAGVAFSLTPQTPKRWRFMVVNDFCVAGDFHCADGQGPYGELLIDGMGNMFGTTFIGGMPNQTGAAYELVPANKGKFKERALFAFAGFSPSQTGNEPTGGFAMDGAGLLYGTTSNGGSEFEGVLYRLKLHGKRPATQTILHTFCSVGDCDDGASPWLSTPVFDADGTLFGTARGGGGVVYRYQGDTYSTIYSFCAEAGCLDGSNPGNVIVDGDGNLWGATQNGGPGGGVDTGPGTVFELTP